MVKLKIVFTCFSYCNINIPPVGVVYATHKLAKVGMTCVVVLPLCMYICLHTHTHIYIYTSIFYLHLSYIYMYVCMSFSYTYLFMYLFIYIYISFYIYISKIWFKNNNIYTLPADSPWDSSAFGLR
jgi:hypothetical protein